MNWRTALSGPCVWLLASCAAPQKSLPPDFSRTATCAVAAFVNEVAQMHFLAGIVTANEQMDVRVDSEALAHSIEDAIVVDLRPTFGERVSPLKVPNRSDISRQLAHPPESSADAARRIGDASSKLVRLATDQGYSCLIVVIQPRFRQVRIQARCLVWGFSSRSTGRIPISQASIELHRSQTTGPSQLATLSPIQLGAS